VKEILQKVLKGETVNYETRDSQLSQWAKWYSIRHFPVINDEKKIFGIIMAVSDITERKQSESETSNLVDSLHSKNKDLRQFAYIVSHNLRSPIAKILGLVSLFDSDPEDKNFNGELLVNIADEATNLDNVVKDMNTIISTRDAENEKNEYISFDTEFKLIEQVLESEITESEAVITTDFTDPAGIVSAKSNIYSIMYNLLSNAIKYRSSKTPLSIHLQTQQDDKFICLSVKDNGMGIDLVKNREKIFGLYRRFHGDKIPGKGIGLNLVKTQAESLGGRVEVESKVNHGSIFKIFLPQNNNRHATS
jgi:signal transduction histidine kinase